MVIDGSFDMDTKFGIGILNRALLLILTPTTFGQFECEFPGFNMLEEI